MWRSMILGPVPINDVAILVQALVTLTSTTHESLSMGMERRYETTTESRSAVHGESPTKGAASI